jgi:hypothetical protein
VRALKASAPFHSAVKSREKGGKTGSVDARGGGFVVNGQVSRHGHEGVAAIGSWHRDACMCVLSGVHLPFFLVLRLVRPAFPMC